MKIGGMEASSTSYTSTQNSVTTQETGAQPQQIKPVEAREKHVQTLQSGYPANEYERKDLPISEKVVIDAIEKANKAISGANRKFEFSIHEKTKEIMVKVIDSDTGDVIREIPNEKILDMVARMWEMAGIMVDERR